MATKTLAQKLYIRPGYTVALLNAPKGAADMLAPLPEEVTVVTNATKATAKVDLVLCFVKTSDELEKNAKELKATLDKDTILWFAYPKQSSKVASDLTRDKGWKQVYDMGYQGVASIAIDNIWSGVRFRRGLANTENDAVAQQYAGDRAVFLPLYEKLVGVIQRLGPDVVMAPRQTYVAFSRGRQFALIKPTSDHLDLVLKLPKTTLSQRLIAAAGLGSGSMSHRVAITTTEDIDKEVIGWIQDAYRSIGR